MSDKDIQDVICVFWTLIGLFACAFLVNSQRELCVAMPEQWFTGFVSAIVLVLCAKIQFHQRE